MQGLVGQYPRFPKKSLRLVNLSADVRERDRDVMLYHMVSSCARFKGQDNASHNDPLQTVRKAVVSFQLRRFCLFCGKPAKQIQQEYCERETDLNNATVKASLRQDPECKMEEMAHRVRKKRLETMEEERRGGTEVDRQIRFLGAEKNRLLSILRSGIKFKSMREAIIWLLGMRRRHALLPTVIHMDDVTPCNFFSRVPSPVLNKVFGEFLRHEEGAVKFSSVCKQAFDYVYHNDKEGPWRLLSSHDPNVLLQTNSESDGLDVFKNWRIEFLKGRLRFESERMRCYNLRSKGIWLGQFSSLWNSLPYHAQEILSNCRVLEGRLMDPRKPGTVGRHVAFKERRREENAKRALKNALLPARQLLRSTMLPADGSVHAEPGCSGTDACTWLETNEPFANAALECRLGHQRVILDFADCSFVGIRYEDVEQYNDREDRLRAIQGALERIKSHEADSRKKMTKRGRKKMKSKLELLKAKGREEWRDFKDVEKHLPERIRKLNIKLPSILKAKKKRKRRKRRRKKKSGTTATQDASPALEEPSEHNLGHRFLSAVGMF
jgi:hypothetical protein